jgi:hypothetical protein
MRGKDMVEVTKEAVAEAAAERMEADREADLAACDELIGNIRRRVRPEAVHDPASYYFQRPELLADAQEAAERNIADMKARHGLVERQPSPEEIAQAQFEERWQVGAQIIENENFNNLFDKHLETLAALPAYEHERRQREIVERLGFKDYDALVREAKDALKPGEKLPKGVEHEESILRYLSTLARYTKAREAADPSRRRAA